MKGHDGKAVNIVLEEDKAKGAVCLSVSVREDHITMYVKRCLGAELLVTEAKSNLCVQ